MMLKLALMLIGALVVAANHVRTETGGYGICKMFTSLVKLCKLTTITLHLILLYPIQHGKTTSQGRSEAQGSPSTEGMSDVCQ